MEIVAVMPEACKVTPPTFGGGVGVGVGFVTGVDVGCGVGVGFVTGVDVGWGVGVGLVDPLQALPLTVKLVGTGLLDVQVPLKPGLMDPFGATAPL